MTFARRLASLAAPVVLAAAFAVTALSPSVAAADDLGRVAQIAAKGSIPKAVPVEAGLALCLAAALVAVGMERRSRR